MEAAARRYARLVYGLASDSSSSAANASSRSAMSALVTAYSFALTPAVCRVTDRMIRVGPPAQ